MDNYYYRETHYDDTCTCGHVLYKHGDGVADPEGCKVCNCIAFRLEEARLLR